MTLTSALTDRLKEPRLVAAGGFIDGKWNTVSSRGKVFRVANPATGEVLAQIPDLSTHATREAIDAAHAARRAKYDTDGDGNLSLSEFAGLWTELTQPLKIRGFQFLDTDGDAKISKAEIDERLAGMVRRFDRNGDGTLSMEDRRYRHWSRQSDDDDDKGKR